MPRMLTPLLLAAAFFAPQDATTAPPVAPPPIIDMGDEAPDEAVTGQEIVADEVVDYDAIERRLGQIFERLEEVGWVTDPAVRAEDGIVTLRGHRRQRGAPGADRRDRPQRPRGDGRAERPGGPAAGPLRPRAGERLAAGRGGGSDRGGALRAVRRGDVGRDVPAGPGRPPRRPLVVRAADRKPAARNRRRAGGRRRGVGAGGVPRAAGLRADGDWPSRCWAGRGWGGWCSASRSATSPRTSSPACCCRSISRSAPATWSRSTATSASCGR